jgi:ABC-2 type transport system ATP-binding protein
MMVAVEQVSHRYRDRQALQGVNLQIRAGALVGLLGPNGGGKSTLLGLLSTRLPLQQGSVQILGHDLKTRQPAIRAQIGVVFQRPALDRRLTVMENLRYAAQIYGITDLQRCHQVLDQFHLQDRAHSRVDTLSGGLARRAELAKAMIHRPQLLLLDEPSTGLDPGARRDLWDLLKSQGITTLVTTHLASEGELCDEVHILHQGQLVASGPPHQLQQQIGHDLVAIRAVDPAALSERLHSDLNLSPQLVNHQLQLECPSHSDLIVQLMQRYREQILELTYSKPSLEDVFFQRTGQLLQEEKAAR